MIDSENNNNNQAQDTAPLDALESEAIARDIKEGRLSCFVGSGTALNGELSFRSMARVDGHLIGKVNSEKGTLIVGESGQVDASVSVATAIINGTINGDVTTLEHLELRRTAKIVGNVRTPRLIMEDGAVLEGNCGMLKTEEKTETRAVRQAAATASPTFKSNPLTTRPGENPSRKRDASEPGETKKEEATLTLDVI